MLVDFILIIIMALCIFLGYKRGLIKVSVKIIGLFASLIIALVFYSPVSDYIINNTEIPNSLEELIEGRLYDKEEIEEKENRNKGLFGNIENYANEIKEESISYIAKNIAISIIRVRNMDRIIYNCKNPYDILKTVYKCNRKNTCYKTI